MSSVVAAVDTFATAQRESLFEDLADTGYAVLPFDSANDFHNFCRLIGEIRQSVDVRLTDGKMEFPYISGKVPFHTDNPAIPIVGWFCLQQDEHGGESRLIDIRPILSLFTEQEISSLQSISLPSPVSGVPQQILRFDASSQHIYFIHRHWLEAASRLEGVGRSAIEKFLAAVSGLDERKEFLKVRLLRNQALFVNNRVILHSRGEISKNSARHLIRNYISIQGWP